MQKKREFLNKNFISQSRLFKNKKADEGGVGISLVHLVELLLAIGIVLLLLYLGLKLASFFIGRQDYDSTINNLEVLTARINEMIKDKKPVMSQTTVYTILDDYILVGFDYENKGTMRTECTKETIVTSRPRLCQSQSCLCIYKNEGGITDWKGYDFDNKLNSVPLKCKPFDQKIVFLAPQAGDNFEGSTTDWKPSSGHEISYNYLALYGQCGALGKSWGVKQISLEKYKEGDIIFIYMTDNIVESAK